MLEPRLTFVCSAGNGKIIRMQRGQPKNRLLDNWIGIPLLNLFASLHPRRHLPKRIDRIGVLCSTALGDTLLFSAALQDLRAAFPAAHIVHFYTRHNVAAAEIIPGADERVYIELTDPISSIRALRSQHIDILFDFTSWQRLTAFFTLFSGAKYTVGFRTPGQYRSRGYDTAVEHRADRHELLNFRALLQQCGLRNPFPTDHDPVVAVTPISPTPFADEPDVVALHLWAAGQRSWLREWPEERWVALAERINRTPAGGPSTLFLITGSPNDLPRIEPFVERMRAAGLRCAPFVSPDGFHTLTAVLQHCRVVISVNTGVMHLAAIVGARVVCLSGPTNNARWGPIGPHVAGIQAPGPGCGYLNLGFEFDGRATDCMERITVDMVEVAVHTLLAQAEAR